MEPPLSRFKTLNPEPKTLAPPMSQREVVLLNRAAADGEDVGAAGEAGAPDQDTQGQGKVRGERVPAHVPKVLRPVVHRSDRSGSAVSLRGCASVLAQSAGGLREHPCTQSAVTANNRQHKPKQIVLLRWALDKVSSPGSGEMVDTGWCGAGRGVPAT